MSNPPKNTRPFYDPKTLRDTIFNVAVEGFNKKLNTIETADFKLQAKNLKIDLPKITTSDKKKAVLEKKDLTVPLKGTIDLIHKASGKVVDTKNTTIAQIPYVTNHNTVIYNGSEYESVNQQRLLPGVYSRIRQDGIPEAHINPEARTGKSGRIIFLPDRQLFILMIKNSQIRLYGILRDLGIQDNAIKEAWGDKIYQVNKSLYKGDEIDKLYSLFIGEEKIA
jgi:DNA-directed RNA polymerase beta subunit